MAGTAGWILIRRLWALMVPVLAVLLCAALAPGYAQAQQPPTCQEYPDLPACVDAVGPGAGGPTAQDGLGGELPFTGYPLSPLVLLMLALLATGVLARLYLALRQRPDRASAIRPSGSTAD